MSRQGVTMWIFLNYFFLFNSRILPAARPLFTSGCSIFYHIMMHKLCMPELEMFLREALEPQLDLERSILKNAVALIKWTGKGGDEKQNRFLMYNAKTGLWDKSQFRNMGFISWVSPQTSALLGKILTRSNLETHSVSLLQMQNLCLCDIHMNFKTFLSEYW